MKSIVELIVGNLDEKREYRRFMNRVNDLPKDYRFAFKKIMNYSYYVEGAGFDIKMFTDLVELFEISSMEGKSVVDVIGSDVSGFCDELISASSKESLKSKEKLNKEIFDYFNKGGR